MQAPWCSLSFERWRDAFRDVGVPSVTIALRDASFVEYLLADGVVLPPGLHEGGAVDGSDTDEGSWMSSDSDDHADDGGRPRASSSSSSSSSSSPSPSPSPPRFDDLVAAVRAAIAELGGAVFVKTNWSSANDARWVITGSRLCCRTCSDVLLALKSSSSVSDDLERARALGVEPVLVLKAYFESVQQSSEFRAFVVHGRLVGATQRYTGECYDGMVRDRAAHERRVEAFFERLVAPRMAALGGVDTYTFDVFVSPQSVWLLDLGVLDAQTTNTGLYSADELVGWDSGVSGDADSAAQAPGAPLLRVVHAPTGIQPSSDFTSRFPADLCATSLEAAPEDMVRLVERAAHHRAATARRAAAAAAAAAAASGAPGDPAGHLR